MQAIHRTKRGDRGVALIEAMVACLVFLIGLLGVTAYLGYGRIALVREARSRVATQVAHSRLETLRTAPYSALGSFAETDTPVALGGPNGLRNTIISPIDENSDGTTDYIEARVNVSWTEGNVQGGVELVTLFASTP